MWLHMNEIEFPFDNSGILVSKKKLKKQLLKDNNFIEKRIAILGGSTTNEIRNIMELFLLKEGIRPVFYESEYNSYYQDIMFDNPLLVEFRPDIIYIFTTNRNIEMYPDMKDDYQDILEKEYLRFFSMWNHIQETYGCIVIQNNFEMPMYRLLGNRDCYDKHGKSYFIHELNGKMYKFAQENNWFYICDLNYISADYGLRKWQNPKHWYLYKYAMPMEAIPELAFNVCRIIKSIYGKNKKCIALDLDNTLWGGVIGDDGVDGIEIGNENAEAEAYYEFQEYLLELKKLGVLLAIDSKNDYENAIQGLNHPDSLLKPEDFIEIRANWETKDINIKSIADSIGILSESMVFIDDNPAEREIVKKSFSDILAPNIDKIENYIQIIDRLGAFEVTTFSEDDSNRNKMYVAEKKRKQEMDHFMDYDDYLKSLEMHAEIHPFNPISYSRISQLSNKSNQYNLTTKRYTIEEIKRIAEDSRYVTLQGRLEDKFGDNGIVSLIIGEIKDNCCDIILWVMSCRVLKRNMEYAMMDCLVRVCGDFGVTEIIGKYIPSDKNAMVQDHYKRLGFSCILKQDDGYTEWKYMIKGCQSQNDIIKVN